VVWEANPKKSPMTAKGPKTNNHVNLDRNTCSVLAPISVTNPVVHWVKKGK
jgi:hypothetical protein